MFFFRAMSLVREENGNGAGGGAGGEAMSPNPPVHTVLYKNRSPIPTSDVHSRLGYDLNDGDTARCNR
jgi:hypothetical protein